MPLNCPLKFLDSVLLGYLLILMLFNFPLPAPVFLSAAWKLKWHLMGEDAAMCFTNIFMLAMLIYISKNGHTGVEAVDIWFQTEIVFHSNCVFSGKEMAFPTPASQQKMVLSVDFLLVKKKNPSFSWLCTFCVRLNLSQLLSCFINLWA